MQALRFAARQLGDRSLRPPVWENLLVSAPASGTGAASHSVQSSAAGPGPLDRKEHVGDLLGAAEEAGIDRRSFASAAAPEDGGDEKSQKEYWRNLVKERLDEELGPGAEAKGASEEAAACVEATTKEGADAALLDAVPSTDALPPADALPSTDAPPSMDAPSAPPPLADKAAEPLVKPFKQSTSQPTPAPSKPPRKLFGDLPLIRRTSGPRPRPPQRSFQGSNAWLERLLEKQKQLVAQRQAGEKASGGELAGSEAPLKEAAAGGETNPGGALREREAEGDHRGVVAESPGLKSEEREQLNLAKRFADIEGIGAEKVSGLEPEVGLPPLERAPDVSGGSQRRRADEARLSAAAKILAAVNLQPEVVRKESVPQPGGREPVPGVERESVAQKRQVSERALAAADVFKQMQQNEANKPERLAVAEPRTPDEVLSDEAQGDRVFVGGTGAPPEPAETPPVAEAEALPPPGSEAVEKLRIGSDRIEGAESQAGAEGELPAEEEIIKEARAIAHAPKVVREKLAAAADLQKVPVGWQSANAPPSADELNVAYAYPEVLNAADELEWATQALKELMHASTPPPQPPFEEEDHDEEEDNYEDEDWDMSPYERERRRRATAPTQAVEEPVDQKDVQLPKKKFEFVAQRAHPLNIGFLDNFVDERGNIIPRKITGLRKKDQNKVERAIKTARQMGLLPILSDLDWEHPTIMRLYPARLPDDEEEDGEDDEEEDEEEDEEDEEGRIDGLDGMQRLEVEIMEEELADFFDHVDWQEVEELPDPDSDEFRAVGKILEKEEFDGFEFEIREVDVTDDDVSDVDDAPPPEGGDPESRQVSQQL